MTSYSNCVPTETMTAWEDTRSKERWSLVIEEDGAVSLRCRTYYGGDGTPFDEWHNRTLRYTITGQVLDNERLREDLAEGGKLALLIDRIKAGHSVVWDGSNHVGKLTQDARDAEEDLSHALDSGDYADDSSALWDAGEWLSADGSNSDANILDQLGLLPESTPFGTAVDEAVTAAEADAMTNGVILVNTADAIRNVIERERERLAEEQAA
jgi:hypothetical protein